MIAEPISLAMTGWTGTPFSLPRLGMSLTSGEFQTDDATKKITVSHALTGRNRQRDLIKLGVKKTAPNPLDGSANLIYSGGIGITFDRPTVGFSIDEFVQAYVGLNTILTASTNTVLKKVLGLES